jgi:starch phosphorylase
VISSSGSSQAPAIIYEINHRFLERVRQQYPGDEDRVRRMSIIDETGERRVRMANLAIVGSHSVNGVSEIHTELLRRNVFPDFDAFRPELFVNVTNGITPRRWLQHANPKLSSLIHDTIGSDWTRDLGQLRRLTAYADDAVFGPGSAP